MFRRYKIYRLNIGVNFSDSDLEIFKIYDTIYNNLTFDGSVIYYNKICITNNVLKYQNMVYDITNLFIDKNIYDCYEILSDIISYKFNI